MSSRARHHLVWFVRFVSTSGFLPAGLPVIRQNQFGFLCFGNLEVWQWKINKHIHMAEL